MTDKVVERYNAISYIRIISMFMIIVCHFFQFYENELAYWFNVGVQIFFIVSGFLYGKKDIGDPVAFVCKQFKKILIPYYSFIIPISVIYFVFAPDRISLSSFIKAVLCVDTIDGLGHLWFIGYILFCYWITPYLYFFCRKIEKYSFMKMTLAFVALLLATVLFGKLLDFHFAPARVCCYLVGFFFAVYYKKYGKITIKQFGLVFGILAIAANALRIAIKYFCQLEYSNIAYKVFCFVEPYIHLLLGFALFLFMCLLFRNIKMNAFTRFVEKYSFYYYIVHLVFILSPFSTMDLTTILLLNWFITLFMTVACGILLYIISDFVTKSTSKLYGGVIH